MSYYKNIQKLNYEKVKQSFMKLSNDVRKNVINKYRKNENNLRLLYEDKKIMQKEIENYFKELNLYDDYTFNLVNKEVNLWNLINNNSKENSEIYYLLMQDYFIIFLEKNINKNKNLKGKDEDKDEKLIDINFIKMLYLMANLRINSIEKYLLEKKEDKNNAKNLAKTINWIESYSKEIILLQNIFSKLNDKIPELYKQIEELINNKTIQYEIPLNKFNYFSIINEVFFLLINSFLRLINSKKEIYNLPEKDLKLFITEIREIYEIISQLENDLNLYTQEAFTLNQILKLYNLFYTYNNINSNSVMKIIKYFEDGIVFNNDIKKLCDNIKEFYKYLIEQIEDKKKIQKTI